VLQTLLFCTTDSSAIQVSHLLTLKEVIMHLEIINEKLLGCWSCIWVTPRGCGHCFCFRETYCLHLHGRKV